MKYKFVATNHDTTRVSVGFLPAKFEKITIISIMGVLLAGLTIDTFRFFGYWILAGISWRMISDETGK